jgi:hypothetical protein
MIEAFRTMLDQDHLGFELHIAGALHAEPQHRRYFLKLQEMARRPAGIFPSRRQPPQARGSLR